MKKTNTLQIIQAEPDLQRRVKLLVGHGFKDEASKLIRDMAHVHTAMFHCDWHDQDLSRPLPRVTKDSYAVYVIITTNSKLDYHPAQRKEKDQHIIFELGWEREVLGWTEEESLDLLYMILAQALARPLNQWSFKQAEGTGRATRRLLPADDSLSKKIAALHLVYHLRQADFGHICGYLRDIPGFPFEGGGLTVPLDEQGLVNWIVERLKILGWTHDQIRKELVEWIWLKTDTHPQWLLPVAKAFVFGEADPTRTFAVRRWITQKFDYLLDTVPSRGKEEGLAEIFRQLFKIGQFGPADEDWVTDKLVQQMALGKVSSVRWFLAELSTTFGFIHIGKIREKAIETAKASGNHGTAVALIQDGGMWEGYELAEIVAIRSLSTKLE